MRPRIAQEFELLRQTFGEVDHVEEAGSDWFRIKRYSFPPGWTKDNAPLEVAEVLFNANASYPAGDPYGFWTPPGTTFNGQPPLNVTEVSNSAFGGQWAQFSWAPDGTWRPGATVSSGSNLTDWALSFAKRLGDGI